MSETGCGSSTQLIATALQLGAREVPGWSVAEERLARGVSEVSAVLPGETRQQILAGGDPLGTAFCNLRSSAERRGRGAVYTPPEIVTAMLDWLEPVGTVARIVDPGCGSGRFLIEAGKRFPSAKLLGIELDPLAALLSRANLAVNGMSKRAEIHVADYCEFELPPAPGRTLFLGNPPYVRHHQLTHSQKDWLTAKAAEVGIPVSRLSGLHLYFYLATFLKSNAGDVGCFITAAEWMEVNYGKFLRRLLLEHLGGQRLALLEPAANPFPDAATTAAIVQFEVGKHPEEIPFQRCGSVSDIVRSRRVRLIDRKDFQREPKWSRLGLPRRRTASDLIPLGELCRVHRGQATGANQFWIVDGECTLPESVLHRTVTRARELLTAGPILEATSPLKRVIDLPADLDGFERAERREIECFLQRGRAAGINQGYLAAHRRVWWSIRLRSPAPILATYMARRSPVFVVNVAEARHLNIAHGLYPREPLSQNLLRKLANYLTTSVTQAEGRTYAGGLTKFEPREMERLLVPRPELLNEMFKDEL